METLARALVSYGLLPKVGVGVEVGESGGGETLPYFSGSSSSRCPQKTAPPGSLS